MSMQNQENNKLVLNLIFPDWQQETILCDSVRLTVKDSLKGKNGGLYGIRPGHAKAVFLLDEGITEAFLEGKCILRCKTPDGFARVENNEVTLVIGYAKKI